MIKYYSKKYQLYLVAFLAIIVRYYDYALFGLSATILAQEFIPNNNLNHHNQLTSFFAIFSVSVLARPIGSIFFGKIGDQLGRIVSVKIATIFAALATMLIGLLPSYHYLGVGSVILLTLCRMLFVASLAGEVDGIKILVVEKAGKYSKILAISIVAFSSQLGVLIASLMYYLAINSSNSEFLWRLNFIIGAVGGLVVFFLRDFLQESHIFLQQKSKIENHGFSIWQLIKAQGIKFVLAILIHGSLGAFYNFLIIFLANFLASTTGIISAQQSALYNVSLIITYAVACLVAGLSYHFLTKKKYEVILSYIALILSIIAVSLLCLLYQNNHIYLALHHLIVFLVPFYALPLNIKIQSIFPTKVRMRMCSLSHSLGSMIFSSTTPLISILIWQFTGQFYSIFMWLLFLLLITLVSLTIICRIKYKDFLKFEHE